MNIGDKFILTNEAPYNPYTGHNEVKPDFITVEIIEKHEDAKGEFTDEVGSGYVAKGSDGILYSYNYPTICEGFGETPWTPYISNEAFEKLSDKEKEKYIVLWMDVTKYQCPDKALFVDGNDFIEYCDKHQRHFYTRKGCFFCKNAPEYRQKVNMNMTEHKWAGWY